MDVKNIISEIEACNSLDPEHVEWLLSNYTPIASKRKRTHEPTYYNYENVYLLDGRYFIVYCVVWEARDAGDTNVDDVAFAEEVKPVIRGNGEVQYVPLEDE